LADVATVESSVHDGSPTAIAVGAPLTSRHRSYTRKGRATHSRWPDRILYISQNGQSYSSIDPWRAASKLLIRARNQINYLKFGHA